MKTEILYGIHPVGEALAAGRRRIHEIYLVKEKNAGRIDPILTLAESRSIARRVIAPGDFSGLVGAVRHQGVAARVSPYSPAPFADLLQTARNPNGNFFLLLLDNILDPQNLGAVIRTAACAGVDGVVVPKDRSALPTPAVSKASAGALEHIRLSVVTNLVQTINACKQNGLWIIGLQKDAPQPLYAGDLTGSVALVLGGEQKGLRRLVKAHCDFLLSIPQQGPVDSLNAATAAAIAMYEAVRQRQGAIAPGDSS
jgi:23S rRNA (guanosine2251-2'-O)-methyltransferase